MSRLLIIYFSFFFFLGALQGQPQLDSLYAILRVQSKATIIGLLDDGFYTIGYGTDIAPFAYYGTVFTAYECDGTVRFSTFKLDSNQNRQILYLNSIHVDSFIYATFQGWPTTELLKFDPRTGEIVHRAKYFNAGGDEEELPYPFSVHLLNDTTILINAVGYAANGRLVTQLCFYSIPADTFDYQVLEFPGYHQRMTDFEVTPEGYVLSGNIERGFYYSTSFETRDCVIWLDKDFREVNRYLSPAGELRHSGLGFDMMQDHDGSIVVGSSKGRVFQRWGSPWIEHGWRPSLYKLDADGKLLWSRLLGQNNYLFSDVMGVIPSSQSDGYIVIGSQPNFSDSLYFDLLDSVNAEGEYLRFEALIAKVSTNGDSLWSRRYFTADFLYSRAEFHGIIPHPDGGYLICGSANKRRILPTDPVIYSWILWVDEYGCAVPGCHEIVSADDPEKPAPVRFFPNPARDILYVYQQEEGCMEYAIHDLSGRRLHRHRCCEAGSTVMMDISRYPPGAYVLTRTDSSGRQRAEQWVKQ